MKETKYAGTQTEKNLMAAFAGESEARNKYTYFASKAKKEGYEQIAALFLKTADNEKEHQRQRALRDGIIQLCHPARQQRRGVGVFGRQSYPQAFLHLQCKLYYTRCL